jgi:hypothetical protein
LASDSGSGRRIYSELADQYKMMDAASNVVKRNVLAQHLRDVIDVLEQRVRDSALYNLKRGSFITHAVKFRVIKSRRSTIS